MTNSKPSKKAESGEQKLVRRRRAFFLFVIFGLVVAAGAGLASGLVTAKVEQGLIPEWAVYTMLAATAAGFIWFGYRYYHRIDELDLMDNLWANTVGIYVYVIITFVWMALDQAGIASPPQHLPILISTIVASGLAYLIRRIGVR